MAELISPDALDLRAFIRPGDRILWGQGSAEPQTLIRALVEQRARLGGVTVFLTISFLDILQPEHADHIRFEGLGGLGTTARLARAGLIDVYPTHFGAFCRDLGRGRPKIDMFMVQLAGPDARGRFSFATDHAYGVEAVRHARVVIAEVNDQAPFIEGAATLGEEDLDVIVRTGVPLAEMPRAQPDETDRAIARHVIPYVEDRATLEVGVGGVPSAILEGLAHHRDLGVHSGMLGDGLFALMEAGVITNAAKPVDPGVSVCCALYGSRDFYRRAAHAAVDLRPGRYTADISVMARLDRFVAINSAIQVDLTGQVNAECVDGRYVGGAGSQVEFIRGARAAEHGRAIIALRSRAPKGQPRIVPSLAGAPVTSSRIDVDIVATEWGAAELAGKTIGERLRALVAIAHPDDREALARAARDVPGQGRFP